MGEVRTTVGEDFPVRVFIISLEALDGKSLCSLLTLRLVLFVIFRPNELVDGTVPSPPIFSSTFGTPCSHSGKVEKSFLTFIKLMVLFWLSLKILLTFTPLCCSKLRADTASKFSRNAFCG